MNLSLSEVLLFNPILLAAISAWVLAQVSKVFIEYFKLKRWNWALVFEAGGMPSSHSALVCALAFTEGYLEGLNTAAFGIAVILAFIVTVPERTSPPTGYSNETPGVSGLSTFTWSIPEWFSRPFTSFTIALSEMSSSENSEEFQIVV